MTLGKTVNHKSEKAYPDNRAFGSQRKGRAIRPHLLGKQGKNVSSLAAFQPGHRIPLKQGC